MQSIYSTEFFYDLLFVLFLVGFVVFVALYFVDAGYGKMRSDKWGPAMNNKAGWLLMEAPVFLVMIYMCCILNLINSLLKLEYLLLQHV